MIIKHVNLDTVVGITSKLPENTLCEFAFAGKSNVGKSSLINALMNRKSYARVSQEPGKTQTINYYNINDELYLVDLPGYGYAKTSRETKEKWGKMIERYLNTSNTLQLVFLLVDMRHEPSANDIQMFQWILNAGFSPVVVATKADKLSRNEQARQKSIIRKTLNMRKDEVLIPFSSVSKFGRDDIWNLIESVLNSEDVDEDTEESMD